MEVYGLLLSEFGPQNWWPAETELEMMIGAVLTQNTAWNNAERAIQNLKNKNLLSVNSLYEMSPDILAEYIKPAGYYNLKAKRLKSLVRLIKEGFDGNIEKLFSLDTESLRKSLLSVNGIGMETADSIVLYGAGRSVFVVDAYTYRILARHGLIYEEAGYEDIQVFFMDNLDNDAELFKEFHALIVKAGKEFCKKKPLCSQCPLRVLEGWEA